MDKNTFKEVILEILVEISSRDSSRDSLVDILHVIFSNHSIKFQIIKRFKKNINTWKVTYY